MRAEEQQTFVDRAESIARMRDDETPMCLLEHRLMGQMSPARWLKARILELRTAHA
jgi:hypothetical protein